MFHQLLHEEEKKVLAINNNFGEEKVSNKERKLKTYVLSEVWKTGVEKSFRLKKERLFKAHLQGIKRISKKCKKKISNRIQ